MRLPNPYHDRQRRALVALACGALAVATLPSQASAQEWRVPRGASSSVDTTLHFQAGGLLDAEQISGDIVVRGWDRQEIRVRGWTEKGRVVTELSSSSARIRVEGERDRRGSRSTGDSRFELTVPVGTRVRARSVSGDVEVGGTRSEVEISSVSGDLGVLDAVGITSASTVSGDVRAERISGDLSVRSVSGDVMVRELEGDARASSVSGELTLMGLRSRTVIAKSTSGDIEYSGEIRPDGRYDFTTHSGDVTLYLPASVGAELSMRTFSGELESAFPVTLGGRGRTGSNRSMDFTLGGGGARISIATFSGDLQLRKGEDRSRH